MRKTNIHDLMELVSNLLNDNGINLRQFSDHYYRTVTRNKKSMLKTVALIKEDVENSSIVNSSDLHPDLIEEFCNE